MRKPWESMMDLQKAVAWLRAWWFRDRVHLFPSLLPLLLCTSLTMCGRQQPAPSTEAAADDIADGKGRGCVWVADASSGGGRLYLCGTIHILRDQDYPLAPAYEAAYQNSDKLVLELPPGEGSSPELSRRMAQIGMFSADGSLEASISAEAWARVKAWAERRGVEASSLNRFRPWFVCLLMTNKEYSALGATPDLGVDTQYDQRAKVDGKTGEGLETADFQIQLFASLNGQQQRDLLDQTLAEMGTVAQEYEKMIAAWKDGDLEALHAMLYREAEQYPELTAMFLTARNLVWVEKLDAMLRRGEKAMVLVGAGHLTGDSGLIELLRRRGHRVKHDREMRDR
jgi:uncharacterized protein